MSLEQLVPIGWLMHIVSCHFLVRHIRHGGIRASFTIVPCIILTYLGCRNQPPLNMVSVVVISTYWMMSIRMIQMIVFYPDDERRPFHSFFLKLFWSFFPVIPTNAREKQWPVIFDFLCGFAKMILNHWLVRWLSVCEPSENYARSIMTAVMVLTSSYMADITLGFVRLVTRDKYTLLSINNFPLLSKSLREFWGRRYNRLTSTVFNESLFKPIKQRLGSPMVASLVVFIVSGLLHAHIALILFNDTDSIVSTFWFFLLHGFLCCIESYLPVRLPAPVGWFVTHTLLVLTLPFATGPSTKQGPVFFKNSPPAFFDAPWVPRLPVPNTCLA